jgi:hypothetical protein
MAAHGTVTHVREVAKRLREAAREHAAQLAAEAAAAAPANPSEQAPPPPS